jgi:Icc-related predicted phosphoesterase
MRAGHPCDWPGPAGFENADLRVVDVAGLRIAGLGGCLRYRPGPNQWSEAEQARRARRLVRIARRARRKDGRAVDVLLTHAPPRHCGDREDGPHRGFECLHALVEALRPRLLVHGHIHPHGEPVPDRMLGSTRVVNVVGRKVVDV